MERLKLVFVFEVAENLGIGLEMIIGGSEMDAWDVMFIPEGPKPRRYQ